MRSRLRQLDQAVPTPPGGGSQTSTAVAIAGGGLDDLLPDLLLYADAPALDGRQLPDGSTVTYSIVEAVDADFAHVAVSTVIGVQTGAGGNGSGPAVFAGRLTFDPHAKFVGLRVNASDGVDLYRVPLVLKFAAVGS